MKNALVYVGILMLYVILTGLMTYPLIFNFFDHWNGTGDIALNTWIISWNVHKLTTSLSHYFDTNIFYPYKNTLAFSEHLFSSALIALPVLVLFKNPVFAYNLLFLFSFILSAFGMYLLVMHYTRNPLAAFVSGLIYAFIPWRFMQLWHLQLLTYQWLPFALLFLDRFFSKSSFRNLFLFWLFFIMQFLASFYLAVYASLIITCYVIFKIVQLMKGRFCHREELNNQTNSIDKNRVSVTSPKDEPGILADRQHPNIQNKHHNPIRPIMLMLGKLFLGVPLFLLCVLPLSLPYFQVNKELNFERTLRENSSLSADFRDYIVAPPFNRLYGKLTAPLVNSYSPFPGENCLFPGVIAVLLACCGLLPTKRSNGEGKHGSRHPGFTDSSSPRFFFLFLLLLGFILSLGPILHWYGKPTSIKLPYYYLYHYFPTIRFMRVPARIVFLVYLSLSILAGFGLSQVLNALIKKTHRKWLGIVTAIIFSVLIIIEYLCIPLPLSSKIPVGKSVPAVYRWLAKQPNSTVIIELPQEVDANDADVGFIYLYYSIYHWKHMINGRSGFIPDSFWQTMSEMKWFPDQRSVLFLKSLGVNYIILHPEFYQPARWKQITDEISSAPDLKLVGQFEDKLVYEIISTVQPQPSFAYITKEFFMPTMILPGKKYSCSLRLKNNSSSFINFPFNTRVKVTVTKTNNSQLGRADYTGYCLLPPVILPNGIVDFPIKLLAPQKPGIYSYRVDIVSDIFTVALNKTIKIQNTKMDTSLNPNILKANFTQVNLPSQIIAGRRFIVTLRIKNTGNTLWIADYFSEKGEVQVGSNGWYFLNGTRLSSQNEPNGVRARLPCDISPGQEFEIPMQVIAPAHSGIYLLKIDMVDEFVTWFENCGSFPLLLHLPVSDTKSTSSTIPSRFFDSFTNPEKCRAEYKIITVPNEVKRGKQAMIDLEVTNTGDSVWLNSDLNGKGMVHLGCRWYTGSESNPQNELKNAYSALYLTHYVLPGQKYRFTGKIMTPDKPGVYLLELNLVNEMFNWFNELGSKPIFVNVKVI